MQGAIVGLGLFATLVSVATYQREPWRTVIADLVRADDGTRKVLWVDDTAVPNFDYYIGQNQGVAAKLKWAPLYSRDLPRLPELAPEPGDAMWFVTAENRYRRLVALLPATFYEQYELAGERHEIGIGAYLFRRRVQPIPGAPVPFIRTKLTIGELFCRHRWASAIASNSRERGNSNHDPRNGCTPDHLADTSW